LKYKLKSMIKKSEKLLYIKIIEEFKKLYGKKPDMVVKAPGRVNLIGEHTDYNDGYVLPAAINRYVYLAAARRSDNTVRIFSENFKKEIKFSVDKITRNSSDWAEYIKGSAWALKKEGYNLSGFDGVLSGTVPIGASLSSSAALVIAVLRTFLWSSEIFYDPLETAKAGQLVETDWIGMDCGIMDQMISSSGVRGHALLIDCASLDIEPIPLPPDTAIIVLDTSTRRELVNSSYNKRRYQCKSGSDFFKVSSLREVCEENFSKKSEALDPITRKRVKHVVYENKRVLQAVTAMKNNHPEELGRLMYESHKSLRDDFEVSSSALNTIVECAMDFSGSYGAKMTGAGFGGCAIALIKKTDTEKFINIVSDSYFKKSGLNPKIYHCETSDGVKIYYNGTLQPT
jgi:galactokinase